MGALYTRYFGDSRRCGCIDGTVSAGGDIVWQRPIDISASARARLVLSSGDTLIVDGLQDIFAFSPEGDRLWKRSKWPSTQIALQNSQIYYTSPGRKTRMEAVTIANEPKITDYLIPDVGDDAHLTLFEPIEKGLIAQVQYGPKPDIDTSELVVYQTTGKRPMYDWSRCYPHLSSPLLPVLCHAQRRLVTSIPGEILVFDLDSEAVSPEPIAHYPFPLGSATAWVSCDDDGNLYWSGRDEAGVHLVVTDFDGQVKRRFDSLGTPGVPPLDPTAPPVVAGLKTFLLTPGHVLAVEGEEMAWYFTPLRGLLRACTALTNGSVLVTTSDTVYYLNERGEIVFDVVVDELIVTPPVIDTAGKVYVASAETLYAIG